MTQALTPPLRFHISRLAVPQTLFSISRSLTKARGSKTIHILDRTPTALRNHRLSLIVGPAHPMSDMATWKSNSTGGTTSSQHSKASTLFGLDEEDKTNILVYRYRSGCKALEVSTQRDLCRELDADPQQMPFMRVTKKEIPRGNSRLEIRTEDLLLPEDLERNRDKPTLKSSLANVGLPSTAYWKRLLFNSFPELYIVSRSPTTSPASSKNNSPESSQHVSPATTFPVDTPHPLEDETQS